MQCKSHSGPTLAKDAATRVYRVRASRDPLSAPMGLCGCAPFHVDRRKAPPDSTQVSYHDFLDFYTELSYQYTPLSTQTYLAKKFISNTLVCQKIMKNLAKNVWKA